MTDSPLVSVRGESVREVDPEIAEEDLKSSALTHPAVQHHVGDKAPRRVVVVPGRLVNIVV